MIVQLPLGTDQSATAIDPASVAEHIDAERRPRLPWVIVNMVSSVDGATAVDGVSGGLGGDADRAVFLALRGVADVVLVGSGTVSAERYRRARLDEAQQARRRARGQTPVPRIAVVSNAGDIDPDLPLFSSGSPELRPLVLVASAAVTGERRRILEQVAEVVDAGDDRVDVTAAVAVLTERVGPTVLCEGGPVLNGLLAEADLVEEWCLTLAPMLVGGESPRAAVGPEVVGPRALRLDRVWRHEGELLVRYLRERA